MKKILLAGILFFIMQVAGAQKIYFIYIQSEAGTPFFVKTGEKVASSTASGYLILPKLVDSVYTFAVGVTGQAAAGESRFSVTINKRDRGFLLRQTDGKFSLFDLQTLTSLQSLASAAASNETVAKRTDAFTVLLAQAANDPSLLEVRATPAVLPETLKSAEPTTAVAANITEPGNEIKEPAESFADTTFVKDVAVTTPVEDNKILIETSNPDPAQQSVLVKQEDLQTAAPEETESYKRSIVTRKSESSTSEGFGLIFLDDTEGVVDTIRITIPNQSLAIRKEESEDGDLKKFLNMTNIDTTKVAITVDAANEEINAGKKRKGCAVSATEKDFLKLRKNMVAEESDDAMIKEAQKAFKKLCFSTGQIKNLSSLFLAASGKYHFFDAAYGHVSDQEQYAVLQAELNEDYYVNRFKALIAKQ